MFCNTNSVLYKEGYKASNEKGNSYFYQVTIGEGRLVLNTGLKALSESKELSYDGVKSRLRRFSRTVLMGLDLPEEHAQRYRACCVFGEKAQDVRSRVND